MEKEWYSLGINGNNYCGNCKQTFKNLESLDHHMRICPNCKIACVWFTFKENKNLQIIPEYAPEVFKKFIEWAQEELDELEFLELIVNYEEIAEVIAGEPS